MAKTSSLVLLLWATLSLPVVYASPLTPKGIKAGNSSIPAYALTYAPYSHLYSKEQWWPSDVATHVQHVTPEVNFTAVAENVTLEDLNTFNSSVYLTSKDNTEDSPAWLLSAFNTPDNVTGYSSAPATIIVAEKDDGIVDVFYFYFYSYNEGPSVLGLAYGNHVGDWEHSMVRFINEVPTYIYLSAHSSGTAYNYTALNMTDSRATTYIALGSHANYATTGEQDYEGDLAGIFLHDETDAGLYWDVTANYRGYFFDNSTGTFTSAGGADIGGTEQPGEGVDWLYWLGMWGDQQYPNSYSDQYCISTECHYVSGPTGPLDKNLGRVSVCEHESGGCTIKNSA
ncbi:MAG: Vacuolar protein sorting-associated protein 62 [Claussenomyces sp. TS43310]|nr:MAG: Vacuolar protein sorting-associated protein 62 [Claussenomyces sp. TS43310]